MWRARPVFISSTFADMQAERDHLRTHVFPELEERLRKRQHNLEWVDLRMGVATASLAEGEAREQQVLRVCLAEVRRCRPFLIVLLGDRYGWVPPADRMKAAAREEGFAADVEGRSVTELEIDFGVLSDPGQPRSYFYFREPLPYSEMPPELALLYADSCGPDPQAAERVERLKTLKERVATQLPDRVRRYSMGWDPDRHCVTGLEAWSRQVLEDLWARFLDAETAAVIAAPEPSWQQAERDALEDYIEDRTRGFVGRQAVLAQLLRLAGSPDQDDAIWGVCLTGEPGSGKSAIFGELVRQLQATDTFVLAHAAGASPRSHSVETMLLRWIEELAAELGADPGLGETPVPTPSMPPSVACSHASPLSAAWCL